MLQALDKPLIDLRSSKSVILNNSLFQGHGRRRVHRRDHERAGRRGQGGGLLPHSVQVQGPVHAALQAHPHHDHQGYLI